VTIPTRRPEFAPSGAADAASWEEIALSPSLAFRPASPRRRTGPLAALIGLLAWVTADPAQAVPSYSRQTGQECATCHVGAFGPQLTPYGVKFKIGGYTETNGEDTKIPLSGMAVGTFTHTQANQSPPPARFSTNDNAAVQELSAFVAGKLMDHVGAFAQVTYSGIDRKLVLDNVDLRITFDATLLDRNTTFGLSINNNPTIQDPFNTLPAWRYPFVTSDLAPSPAHAPLLDGGLEGRVIGATAYASMDNGLYAEAGGYGGLSRGFLQAVNVIDPTDPGSRLIGGAPYGRLAWFKDMRSQAVSLGIVAMSADLGVFGQRGRADHYRDIGADLAYQYLGDRTHVFTVATSFIHEMQQLDGSVRSGAAAHAAQTMEQFNVTGSYTFDKTYGLTAKYFNNWGSADKLLYAPTGKPDNSGLMFQADWSPFGKETSWGAPWANVRVGVQYTAYAKFDGTTRHASDNNTLMGFVWTAF